MIFLSSGELALSLSDTWLPVLERAIEDSDGRWTREELIEDVRSGHVLIWQVMHDGRQLGVFTTRVMRSKRLQWVLIEDLAGEDLGAWLWEAHTAVEAWARELGATQIMLEGRRGWERALRTLGYETRRIQAVKHLETLQ